MISTRKAGEGARKGIAVVVVAEFYIGWPGKACSRKWHLNELPEGTEKAKWRTVCAKNILGRGNSKCEGSEVGACWVCSASMEEASVSRGDPGRTRGQRGWRRGRQTVQLPLCHPQDFGFDSEWDREAWQGLSRAGTRSHSVSQQVHPALAGQGQK